MIPSCRVFGVTSWGAILFPLLYWMTPGVVFAQIALDRPIAIGPGDKVYLSANDPHVAYLFPQALLQRAKEHVTENRRTVTIHFEAGVDSDYLASIQQKINAIAPGVTVRLLRGFNSQVLPNGATDIDPRFNPTLVPVGEPADFGDAVQYSLTLRRIRCLFWRPTARAVKEAFDAKLPRNVGMIEYSFAATNVGTALTGTTVVPLFVGGK